MLEECIESSITLVERDKNDVLDSDGECSISGSESDEVGVFQMFIMVSQFL